jgi:hypothetical protein
LKALLLYVLTATYPLKTLIKETFKIDDPGVGNFDCNFNYLATDEKSVGRCLRQLLAAAAAAAAAAAKKYSEAPELSSINVFVLLLRTYF